MVAEERLTDDSPLVRGMAVWALGRLAPDRLRLRAGLRGAEGCPEAAGEWAPALGEDL